MTVAIGLSEAAVSLGRQRPADQKAHAELAMALGILGVAQIAAGAYDAAAEAIGQSLALFEALNDEWGIATAQEVLGAIAALTGRADEAHELATQALAVHRRLGGRENIARALDVIGYAAALREDLTTARSCFAESLSLRRANGNRPATAAVLAHLGLVAYLGRRWEDAATGYREGLARDIEIGDTAGMVRCLGQVAALALALRRRPRPRCSPGRRRPASSCGRRVTFTPRSSRARPNDWKPSFAPSYRRFAWLRHGSRVASCASSRQPCSAWPCSTALLSSTGCYLCRVVPNGSRGVRRRSPT